MLAIFALNGSWAVQAQDSARSEVDPTFRPVVASLRSRAKTPILLPRKLPDLDQGESKLYAVIGRATPRAYEIVLGFTPDCAGGNACRLGTLGGRRAGRGQPSPKGHAVKLANGAAAWFVPSTCGANCSDATVTWRDGGIERFAGLKAGDEKKVLDLANAVAEGVRVP